MKKLSWENVISADKIKGVTAGTNVQQVNRWVRIYTEFEFFCFNSIVYQVRSGYADDTGFKLDHETRNFV